MVQLSLFKSAVSAKRGELPRRFIVAVQTNRRT
jgi:hypothetical protein